MKIDVVRKKQLLESVMGAVLRKHAGAGGYLGSVAAGTAHAIGDAASGYGRMLAGKVRLPSGQVVSKGEAIDLMGKAPSFEEGRSIERAVDAARAKQLLAIGGTGLAARSVLQGAANTVSGDGQYAQSIRYS